MLDGAGTNIELDGFDCLGELPLVGTFMIDAKDMPLQALGAAFEGELVVSVLLLLLLLGAIVPIVGSSVIPTRVV